MRKLAYGFILLFIIMAFCPVLFHQIPLFRSRFWFYSESIIIIIGALLSFARIFRRR